MEDEAHPTRLRWSSAPALPAAVALLVGTRLGVGAVYAPAGVLVALGLLGLALGFRGSPLRPPPLGRPWGAVPGLLVAALALGFLNGHLRGAPPRSVPDPERPVTAVVEVTGHWRELGDVRSAAVTARGIEQGRRLWTRPLEAFLHVAGEGEPPPLGSRLRVKGYLSRPAVLGNPPPRPPGPWRLRVKSWRLVAVVAEPGPVAVVAGRLRRAVEEGLEAVEGAYGRAAAARSGPPASPLGLPLARALVLGDASDVPPRVVRALRRSGLGHILAVSGLHVGLAAGLALLLARPLPRVPRLAAALPAVGLYLLLVGPRPSLLRASVMACLAVAALLLERPPSALNALGVAAAGIVLVRPAAVTELGFQLSAGATAGLLLLGPLLAARWEGLPRLLREPLAVTAGAQLGTLPWALPVFCLAAPTAPLVNLLAVPWAGVLLAACGLWTGWAVLAPEGAAFALPALDLLAAPFGWPAAVAPSPWLTLPLAPGAGAATLLAAGVLAALLRPRHGLPVLAAALLWTGAVHPALGGPGPVEAVVIDVGQGDAVLLRDGAETLLVDGGGWPAGDLGGRVLLPALARRGVRRLSRVLLTHPDRDHCGGLVEVASYLAVGEVLTGPGGPEPGAGSCDAQLRAVPGTRHRAVAAGDRLVVGRWRLRVLHPPGGAQGRGGGDNDASVVVRAEAFGRCLLLTGDVEAAAERRLTARYGADLDCDVLKVAHHGSRSSSTGPFLEAVAPSLAVISAGARNPYGHPAPEVLARLQRHRVRVLRTDRDGMVVLRYHPDGRWSIGLPGAPKPRM